MVESDIKLDLPLSATKFIGELGKWTRYYNEDGYKGDLKTCELLAVRQVLLPANLNEYGLSISSPDFKEVCLVIASYLKEKYQFHFASWLKDHDEEGEFLGNGDDSRIREISKQGQILFKEAQIDYKELEW